MEENIDKFFSFCSEINFGSVALSDDEKKFCSEWNNEIISLCKSFPESTQVDALLFFMRHSDLSFKEEINFFKTYYVPTWSIIYWLLKSTHVGKGMDMKDIKNAKTGHAMAMFLHALDDHLNDKQLPATYLTLLLRSQSWMLMNEAMNSLSVRIPEGKKILKRLIDDYYSSIRSTKLIESLDGYCNLFRKQMSTGMIVPMLMSKIITTDKEFTNTIQKAYGSFGIAWRLLDDINDIETDLMNGIHSAIYVCLSEDLKKCWDMSAEMKKEESCRCSKEIIDHVIKTSIIDRIKEKMCNELESAAYIADYYDMAGWADELRCLLKPFKDS